MKKISNNIKNSFVEKAVALAIVAIFIGSAFVTAGGSQSKNFQDVVSSEMIGNSMEESLDNPVLSSSTDSSKDGGSSIFNVFIDTLLGVVNVVVNNTIVNGLHEMFIEEDTKEEIDGDTYQIMTNQFIGFGNEEQQQKSGITIDVWYGLNQKYGHIGIPQDWLNILGEVSSDVNSLVYSLNGAPNVTLTIGPDGRRLVNAGDFNIDIAHVDLVEGINEVAITANNSTSTLTETVYINYTSGNIWPLPYSVNWSNVSNINDVAHVVDGKWSIINDTVRVTEPGYDRLIAIGDVTWTDYEVVVPVTFHSDDRGTGILMRWHGHTDNPIGGTQPKSGWLPLGSIGWYYYNGLEIFGNNGDILARDTGITLSTGVTYIFKMRVETIEGVGGLYSLKVWEQGTAEPLTWDLTGQEALSDPQDGCMMLLSHQRDASFGGVNITPIKPNIINNISVTVTNVTANVTWTTDEVANSSVAYGLTTSYELGIVGSSTFVTDHLVELTGLLPSTTYHYQIFSFTANDTEYHSRDYTFTTMGLYILLILLLLLLFCLVVVTYLVIY